MSLAATNLPCRGAVAPLIKTSIGQGARCANADSERSSVKRRSGNALSSKTMSGGVLHGAAQASVT